MKNLVRIAGTAFIAMFLRELTRIVIKDMAWSAWNEAKRIARERRSEFYKRQPYPAPRRHRMFYKVGEASSGRFQDKKEGSRTSTNKNGTPRRSSLRIW